MMHNRGLQLSKDMPGLSRRTQGTYALVLLRTLQANWLKTKE